MKLQVGILTFLGVNVSLVVASVLFSAGQVYSYQDSVDGRSETLPEVKAIVVLAGGRGRIAAAGDLWLKYQERSQLEGGNHRVPLLYVSGMGQDTTWASFQSQLREGVKQVILPDQVVLENQSRNTVENAQYLADYLMGQQVSVSQAKIRLLLVTSAYHMKRSLYTFEKVMEKSSRTNGLPPVQFETFTVAQDLFGPEVWKESLQGIHVTLMEAFKHWYYNYTL